MDINAVREVVGLSPSSLIRRNLLPDMFNRILACELLAETREPPDIFQAPIFAPSVTVRFPVVILCAENACATTSAASITLADSLPLALMAAVC